MATVLLAEDDDQVRVLAESYLEEQGHEVLSAGTAPGSASAAGQNLAA
jgi:CheY-like chemotaxis protein